MKKNDSIILKDAESNERVLGSKDFYEKSIYNSKENDFEIEGLVSESKLMESIIRTIRKLAPLDTCILLTGSSGVGKTLIAKHIHKKSKRKDKTFVEINCGAIPESLLESELFGYEDGAFTGANKGGKVGLIELADGGTLFLDEIGELPLNLQVKLLKVVQDKRITPVGSTKEKTVDFRLITATNRNIEEMVYEKKFREDLYYRINVVGLEIPDLKERKEDLYALIFAFLDKYNTLYNFDIKMSPEATKKLIAYDWPGNVRELENVMERSVLFCEGRMILEENLPICVQYKKTKTEERQLNNEHIQTVHTINDQIDELEEALKIYEGQTLKEILENVEKKIIYSALKKNKSTSGVAKSLGMSQPTAHRKISKYFSDEINYLQD